jgi:cytoplasmic iron level regulating protein YaaA (DUF328/UPF0246 family)
MLFLLSPAKTLDYETPLPDTVAAVSAGAKPGAFTPRYGTESARLIEVLREKSVADIAALMDLSTDLATLNVERYHAWSPRATPRNSRPALFAFNGDVYDGLRARSLSADELAWAQDHVCLLSGLYGVLRPLDKLQPYRLEMGTSLQTERGGSLYAWWGDTVARHLNAMQRGVPEPVVVNLASQEYFRVTQARDAKGRPVLKARVVECVFEDWKNGEWKVISFFAKRARGAMARHAIHHRIATPAGLESFAEDGYRFAPSASEPDRLVFRRRAV